MRGVLQLALILFCGAEGVLFGAASAAEMQARAIEENICRRFCSFISEPDRIKELTEADKAFTALMTENPEDAGVYVIYGQFCWKFGDQSRALPALRKACTLDPKHVSGLQLLAQCYLRDGRLREALEALRKCAALEPSNAQVQFDTGTLFLTLSNEVPENSRDNVVLSAVRCFRNAVDLDPWNASFAQALGEAIYAMQKPDWGFAISVWQRVRALNPDTDLANYHLARAALRLGKHQAAELWLGQIPLPRRDQLTRYLMHENGVSAENSEVGEPPASKAASDGGPKVVTHTGTEN